MSTRLRNTGKANHGSKTKPGKQRRQPQAPARPKNRPRSKDGLHGPNGFGRFDTMPASMVRVSPSTTITRHSGSESIGAFVSAQTFLANYFTVSPINATLFPWMASTIARGFAEFRFTKLRFRWITQIGSAVNAGIPIIGSCNLLFQYDPQDPAPGSSIQAEQNEGCVTFPPHMNAVLDVDLRKFSRPYEWYMMPTAGESTPNDIRLEDPGKLVFCVSDMAANNQIIGRLYVDYEVEFRRQKIPTGGDFPDIVHYFAGNCNSTNTLGSLGGVWNGNNSYEIAGTPGLLGVAQVAAPYNTMVFNTPGKYLILAMWTGLTSPGAQSFVLTGATGINLFQNWATSSYQAQTASTCFTMQAVSINSAGGSVQFRFTDIGNGTVDVFIAGLSQGTDLNLPYGLGSAASMFKQVLTNTASRRVLAPSETKTEDTASTPPSSPEPDGEFVPARLEFRSDEARVEKKVPEGRGRWLSVGIPPQPVDPRTIRFLLSRGVPLDQVNDYCHAHSSGFLHQFDVSPPRD